MGLAYFFVFEDWWWIRE